MFASSILLWKTNALVYGGFFLGKIVVCRSGTICQAFGMFFFHGWTIVLLC